MVGYRVLTLFHVMYISYGRSWYSIDRPATWYMCMSQGRNECKFKGWKNDSQTIDIKEPMRSRCGRGGLSKSLDNRWCPTWAWSRRWMWGNSLRSKEFPVRELLRRTVANLRRSCNSNVAFFSKRNAQGISTTLMPHPYPMKRRAPSIHELQKKR